MTRVTFHHSFFVSFSDHLNNGSRDQFLTLYIVFPASKQYHNQMIYILPMTYGFTTLLKTSESFHKTRTTLVRSFILSLLQPLPLFCSITASFHVRRSMLAC